MRGYGLALELKIVPNSSTSFLSANLCSIAKAPASSQSEPISVSKIIFG